MISLDNVREVATRQGRNATDISRGANIGHTTAYRIWRGDAPNVTLKTLVAIARYLGVPWHTLVRVDDDGEQEDGG